MGKKIYTGYIINKSQRDKKIFKNMVITNQKTIWLGLIIIYEVQVDADYIDLMIKKLQSNMVTHIGLIKQEFYIHFYCGEELIVVYRDKVFHITADKATWTEAVEYGRNLGIVEKQLDFLTPEEMKNMTKTFK